jgi:heterodisulfide reductase subunit B
MGSQARAGEPTIKPNPNAKAQAKQVEYAVFNKHCTQCHVSVADPERPGKTRDEWYATINLMEGHGLGISQEDADMIVDLLFNLRRGVEDTPG